MIDGNLGKFRKQKQKANPLWCHTTMFSSCTIKVQCADVLALPPSQTGYTLNLSP